MKRFTTIALSLFYLFLSPVFTLALAQEEPLATPTPVFDFAKALSDYQYAYNQYRQAHLQYETAKTAYLKFGTLNSKNEAREKTALMLTLRDETIRTFFSALRNKLAEVTSIDDYNLNLFYLNLDNQVVWYAKHANRFKSAGSLEDLLILAQESEAKYNQDSIKTIYQTLHGIIDYKVEENIQAVDDQTKAIRGKANSIKEAGNKDITLAERWLLEAENRLIWAKQKRDQSNQTINLIGQSRYRDKPEETFYQARFLLEESNQYLKEANSYLLEVIKEIKSGN